MRTIQRFLVVSASGDDVRIVRTRPSLKFSEVAFPLVIRAPDAWGRVLAQQTITLTLPDPDMPDVAIGDPMLGELEEQPGDEAVRP